MPMGSAYYLGLSFAGTTLLVGAEKSRKTRQGLRLRGRRTGRIARSSTSRPSLSMMRKTGYTRSGSFGAVRPAVLNMWTPCARLLHGFIEGRSGAGQAAAAASSSSTCRQSLAERGRPASVPLERTPVPGWQCDPPPVAHDGDGKGRARVSWEAVQTSSIPALQDPVEASGVVVPTDALLDGLFDRIDEQGLGWIALADVEDAIALLNASLGWDLEACDAARLYGFLQGSETGPVGREQFCCKLLELCGTLRRLGPQMSAGQIKTILVAAFEEFDKDSTGHLSRTDFACIVDGLGLKLDVEDADVLYRFLSSGGGMQVEALASEPPLWKEWRRTLNRSIAQVRDKYGWTSMENLFAQVQKALNSTGSIEEKVSRVQRAVLADVDDVCNVTQLVADLSAVGMAVGYTGSEVQEVLTQGTIESWDLTNVAPLAVCLGLLTVNIAKELDELVPKEMTADEAVLYARHFKKHGFSQAEFRRILSSPGCRWCTASPGEVLNEPGDASVRLIVRGSMDVSIPDLPAHGAAASLGPGASIGAVGFLHGEELWSSEVITASEPVVYISWDPTGLRRCLDHDMELSVRMGILLADTFTTNLRAVLKLRRQRDQHASVSADRFFMGCTEAEKPVTSATWQVGFEEVLSSMRFEEKPVIDEVILVDFFMRVNRKLGLGMTRGLCSQLFEHLDADKDGVVRTDEFRSKMTELERCLSSLSGIKAEQLMALFMKGAVDMEDLKSVMPYIDRRMGIGTSDEDCHRLFRHIGPDENGEVSLEEFASKLTQLESSLQDLGGLTVQELCTVLHRGFRQLDLDGDGVISVDEFLQAVRRLRIPITERQARLLHSYLDENKDGSVDLEEGSLSSALPTWLDALKVAMDSQVERMGLRRLGFIAEISHEIAKGPGDALTKLRLMLARLWDGTNELADMTSLFTDSLGTGTAMLRIWQEVSQVDLLERINEVDLLPCFIFLGISSAQVARHLLEGQISNLSEREALLYAKTFRRAGFSVVEFQRLLTHGRARWEELAPGETLEGALSEAALGSWHFLAVAQGSCRVLDGIGATSVVLGSLQCVGQSLGEDARTLVPSGGAVRANEPTTLLMWDGPLLESTLKHDQKIRLKFSQVMMNSMVERLLSTKDSVHSPPESFTLGRTSVAPIKAAAVEGHGNP